MKTVAFLTLIALSALAGACTQSPTSPAPDRGARWEVDGDTTGADITQTDTTGLDSTNAVGGGHSVGSGG
jgi:hypothetical protein